MVSAVRFCPSATEDRQSRTVDDEMHRPLGRDAIERELELLAPPRKRGMVRRLKIARKKPSVWRKGKRKTRRSVRAGDFLDILVQSRRDRRAAVRFFRKVLKGQGRSPHRLITDKLRNYSAAHRTVMPSVVHSTRQYENNRAEVSHQPTRQRERQMRRFTSAAHAQRFLSVHGLVQNLFRVGRHLLRAVHHRSLRTRSFRVWDEVTCAY